MLCDIRADSTTVKLSPQSLTRVLWRVDLAWIRRFKPLLSGTFHRVIGDERFLADAFAELG
jgi:hypothetical protein